MSAFDNWDVSLIYKKIIITVNNKNDADDLNIKLLSLENGDEIKELLNQYTKIENTAN